MQFKIFWESHLKSCSEPTNLILMCLMTPIFILLPFPPPCKVYKFDSKQFLYSEFGTDSLIMIAVCMIAYPIFI